MSTDVNTPNYVIPALRRVLPTLTLIDDLCEGPVRMWEQAVTYIDQWTHEKDEIYRTRRLGEPCFGGLKRTIAAGVGMLHAKPLQIIWGPKEKTFRPWWDNCDGAGNKGDVVASRFSDKALRGGVALILIDHPPAPKDAEGNDIVVTRQNEEEFGLRPRWGLYSRQQVLSWLTRTMTVNNKQVPSRIVLWEGSQQEDGEYGVKTVNQYRVLKLLQSEQGSLVASYRLLEETVIDNRTTYELVGQGIFKNRDGEFATAIPVAIAYTGTYKAPFVADIPLAGVAYANLGHWQYATDLKFNRRMCGFEQLVITGELWQDPNAPEGTPAPDIEFGPAVAMQVKEGGKVEWVGPKGTGLAQLAMGVHEKTVEMDQLGLGFLLPNKSVTTTATEARIDSYAQLATLSTAGVRIQDTLNSAFEITAWYYGVPKINAPVCLINTDFESAKMDSGTMLAYVALVNAGYPKLQALEALQDGGRISQDADLGLLLLEWEKGFVDGGTTPPNPNADELLPPDQPPTDEVLPPMASDAGAGA